jgi:hypothetical protein
MKLGFAALVLAVVSGCSMSGTGDLAPDDSHAGTLVGPGRFHFQGGRPDDDCTPGRASMIGPRHEISEWYDRQLRLRAEREAPLP